ncbi:MAG: Uma2 family endonuclease [Myxococcales bacterium]|nr:MAG: Uma2 family endonuclease [Myxococcales bacterium]
MVVAFPQHHYSFEDYLAVEEMGPVRHEFLGGAIVAMAGGTPEHAALSAAVVVLLGTHLRGKPCRPYSADLRLRVPATGLATYADAAVVCGEAERDPQSPTHVTNPTLVVEVLSPSTEEYDRGDKRQHYQQLASLQDYVLVAQNGRRVEVFSRSPRGEWHHRVFAAGESASLPCIDCTFEVDELYVAAGL